MGTIYVIFGEKKKNDWSQTVLLRNFAVFKIESVRLFTITIKYATTI